MEMIGGTPKTEYVDRKPGCQSCKDSDHAMCSGGECHCFCRTNYKGEIVEGKYYRDSIAPEPGTKGRRKWIGRQAPRLNFVDYPDVHLHAKYNKGRVEWVVAFRASPICRDEGRCVEVRMYRNG